MIKESNPRRESQGPGADMTHLINTMTLLIPIYTPKVASGTSAEEVSNNILEKAKELTQTNPPPYNQ